MEALGYGGKACQQTRSISCLQTGKGPVLRWAGNRNRWVVVSITRFLCGFCIVKRRDLLCEWSQELVYVHICWDFWCSFFHVSSCSTWWYPTHRGHIADTSQSCSSQGPLFGLQSFCLAVRPDLFRSGVSSWMYTLKESKQEGAGQGRFLLFPFLQRGDCAPSQHASLSNLICTKLCSKMARR